MSALYNLEPQPTAKVLLQTSSGDIEVELFAKQTPLASRNFLQLCLDGYFNGSIFHRLVPGFIIQGGDPTGTGEGGEAIYEGGLFDDEFHSRLKFNRRGLLGMANSGRKNDNGSQFFFTLDKAEELTGRNTMFGRIMGDTIYNLMKMAEADVTEVGGSERPLYPTTITETQVLVNPFEDMVARAIKVQESKGEQKQAEKKIPKKKGAKVLLSFGDDESRNAEDGPMLKKAKFNSKLVTTAHAMSKEDTISNPRPKKKESKSTRQPDAAPMAASLSPRLNTQPETQLPLPTEESPSRSPSLTPEPAGVQKVSSLLERTNAQIAELKASMRRNVRVAPSESSRKKSTLEQMIPATSTRGRKRGHGAANTAESLALLNSFRARLDQAPPDKSSPPPAEKQSSNGNSHVEIPCDDTMETSNMDDEALICDLHFIAHCQSCKSWDNDLTKKDDEHDEEDRGWMSHALNFEKDRLGKDLKWKQNMEDSLVVIDPREKAEEIKKEQRAKRLAKSTPKSAFSR